MARKITSKRPNKAKNVSHANNKTNSRQNPNLQTYKVNGVKVRLTARQARTLRKEA